MTTSNKIPAWVDGVLTPVEKLEVHKRGLRHKAVSVFVLRGEFILLQQRAMEKYHTPGLWANTCCTHPDWNEGSLDCANRRLFQELGISGLQPVFRHQLEYKADVGNGLTEHEVVDVYVAQAGQGGLIEPNPEEVMDARWVSHDDLLAEIEQSEDQFTPWLKIYMRDHGDVIFGEDLTKTATLKGCSA